jgi:hypothetical protein
VQELKITSLATLAEYRRQREHVFGSRGSLDWYLRRNRTGLIESGALLLVAGRWFADPERFDSYIVATGAAAAREHGMNE